MCSNTNYYHWLMKHIKNTFKLIVEWRCFLSYRSTVWVWKALIWAFVSPQRWICSVPLRSQRKCFCVFSNTPTWSRRSNSTRTTRNQRITTCTCAAEPWTSLSSSCRYLIRASESFRHTTVLLTHPAFIWSKQRLFLVCVKSWHLLCSCSQ